MFKFFLFFSIIIASNIMGSKGILLHKYIKQAYVATEQEWHDAETAKAQP